MAQTVGNTLFEQATAEERLTNTLDSIQIVITFSDLLLVYVIGTGILLFICYIGIIPCYAVEAETDFDKDELKKTIYLTEQNIQYKIIDVI